MPKRDVSDLRDRGRRPRRPPAFAYGAKNERWSVILRPSESPSATSQTLAAGQWALIDAANLNGVRLSVAGGPVAIWLWSDGKWTWLHGPVASSETVPGGPGGTPIALFAIGDADVGILRQQGGGDEEGDDADGGAAIDWPSLEPPETSAPCRYRVTNGINGQDCDAAFSTKSALCSRIHYVVELGSVWTTEAGQRAIEAELRRCQSWWARYCIYLTFAPVPLAPADLAKLRQDAFKWRQAYPRDNNDATTAFHNLTYALYGTCRGAVARSERRNFKVVMFFERCVSWRSGHAGKQGHNNNDLVGVGRATPGSATVIGRDAIMIHGIEVNSEHIVTHELIHLLGRPASNPFAQDQASWTHDSECQESMSTAPVRGLTPFSFEDTRLLDVVEYTEIRGAGHLRRC